MWIAVIGLAWTCLSVVCAPVIGRAIGAADRRSDAAVDRALARLLAVDVPDRRPEPSAARRGGVAASLAEPA